MRGPLVICCHGLISEHEPSSPTVCLRGAPHPCMCPLLVRYPAVLDRYRWHPHITLSHDTGASLNAAQLPWVSARPHAPNTVSSHVADTGSHSYVLYCSLQPAHPLPGHFHRDPCICVPTHSHMAPTCPQVDRGLPEALHCVAEFKNGKSGPVPAPVLYRAIVGGGQE